MNSHLLSSRDHPIEQKGQQHQIQGERKAEVVRVNAADVISPPSSHTPSLQSFEELGIPASFRAAVESELTTGEKILWLGRPSRNPQVHPRNAPILMMGLCMIGLGLTTAVVSVVLGMGFFPIVFGGVLAFLGLVFQLPRFIDPAKNCRSCYVVTNRRAMLVEMSVWAMGRPTPRSYLPHQLLGLERRNHPAVAGAGDLILEYYFAMSGNSVDLKTGFMHQQGAGFGLSNTAQRVPRGFMLLDQVGEVENLIRTTLLGQLEQTLDEPEHRPAAVVVPEPKAETVSVRCACGVTIEAPENLVGRSVKCPLCSAAVSVPSAESDADTDAAPQQCWEDDTIPADLKAKTLAELDPKEKVVWLGQPVPAIVLVRGSGWFVLGGVGLLITLFWSINAFLPAKTVAAAAHQKGVAAQQTGKTATAPKKEAGPNLLIPIVFSLIWTGCALVPVVRWHFAKRTCYALTNRRAFVYKEGLFGPSRDSYPPLEVASMRRSNSWIFSGSGDLIFRSVTVITTSRTRGVSSSSMKTTHYGFLAIAQIQEVEKLVRETLIDRFVDKLNRASYL